MRLVSPTPARRTRRAARGMTLVELMVAIAVVGVLLATAGPYLGDYVINSRLREAGNLVFSEALIAQSEAIKRNNTVRLAVTATTVQVLDMANPGVPVVLRTSTVPLGVTAPVVNVDFSPEGRPDPFGTAAAIDLSLSSGTCSADLRCPGLRVDAGGAVRLCGNHQACSS